MKLLLFRLSMVIAVALLMLLGLLGFLTIISRTQASYDFSERIVATNSNEIIVSGDSIASAYPAVAYDPDRDEFLVAWKSPQGDGYDVRGQRLSGSSQ